MPVDNTFVVFYEMYCTLKGNEILWIPMLLSLVVVKHTCKQESEDLACF